MKLRRITIIAASGAFSLAACGSSDTARSSTSPPAATVGSVASASASSDFNTADVQFAQGMIPHHQQAVEMAVIALDPTRGASAKVLDLAARIKDAQDPEIEMMGGWLASWGQPMQMDTGMSQAMHMTDGMMTDDEMNGLHSAKGAEFDTMWMQMMVRHHEGAIAMAQTVKTSGSNTDVIALADQVITAQQSEITEMKTMLGS
jgi:uncharacterized protein (DUF305 family)